MPPFIINVVGAAGACTDGWLRSFGEKCSLSTGGRSFSNGEPHRVLAADPKAAGTHSFKERTAPSRCMRTVRIFGKTGGKRPVRFWASITTKRTLVQAAGQGCERVAPPNCERTCDAPFCHFETSTYPCVNGQDHNPPVVTPYSSFMHLEQGHIEYIFLPFRTCHTRS
jgi:hypothetical protein